MITTPAVIRGAIRLMRVAPAGAMRTMAHGIGSIACYLMPDRRRTVLDSLRHLRPDLSPPERRRLARQTFGGMAAASVDLFRLPSATREELEGLVSFVGLEHVDRALAGGRGVIVATAHLGPYELGGACLALRGYRTVAVAEDLEPDVLAALATFREATGMRIITLANAVRGVLQALKDNSVVLLVADRVVGKVATSVDVPFGNGMRALPTGPAMFALKAGAPIIVGWVTRASTSSATYVVHFDPPIQADGNGGRAKVQLTRRVGQRLGELVALHADQWYVFQPEWHGSP